MSRNMDAAHGTLFALLDSLGYVYREDQAGACLRMRTAGHEWQAVIRLEETAILVYSRYPFNAQNQSGALAYCNRANAGLAEGCMLVSPSEAQILVRTAALRTDAYGLRSQLQDAVERNAAIMVAHWAGMYRAAQQEAQTIEETKAGYRQAGHGFCK